MENQKDLNVRTGRAKKLSEIIRQMLTTGMIANVVTDGEDVMGWTASAYSDQLLIQQSGNHRLLSLAFERTGMMEKIYR